MAPRILAALLLLAAGIGFIVLALATSIPVFALTGLVYLAAAWIARTVRFYARVAVFMSMLAAVFAVTGFLAAAASAYVWWSARPSSPDAFYDAPASVPEAPGRLLKQEPITRALPAGGRAWRILYTTTRSEGVAALASAVVIASAKLPDEPRPLIAWAHGTTGVATGCAPSLLGNPYPFDPTLPAQSDLISRGWVVVATDYAGLGTAGPHPYLIGEGEARSLLDAARAVRQMPDLTLESRTIVWGHSQGGHAALWAGSLARMYAPDLDVIGVAALAPVADLVPVVAAAKETPAGRILISYVTSAYAAAYPDVRVDDYVAAPRRTRGMAARCLTGAGELLSMLAASTMERDFLSADPGTGPLATRLDENTPRGWIGAPLLIAQGRDDDRVLPAIQADFARERCRSGQDLEYWTYTGRGHRDLVAADSRLTSDLLRWTSDRLAGAPVRHGCHTVVR